MGTGSQNGERLKGALELEDLESGVEVRGWVEYLLDTGI